MSHRILNLQPLETRANPAGVYTSSLVGTTLTLTGTDDSESISIRDNGIGIIINGLNNTVIDGANSKTIATAVNSIRVIAKGGDDRVSIDQTIPLTLPGRLDLDLGSSSLGNTFDLTTPEAISFGSVRLKSLGGSDTANFRGSTAIVNGDFTAQFGDGYGELSLEPGTTIQGNLLVQMGLGASYLTLDGVTVNKNVTFAAGEGTSTLNLSASTIEGNVLHTAGRGDDSVNLNNSTIKGTTGLTTLGGLGNVAATAANLDVIFTRGGLTLRSTDSESSLTVDASLNLMMGSISVTGRTAQVIANADITTNNLTVTGPYNASYTGNGGISLFNGNARIVALMEDAVFVMNAGTLTAQKSITVSGNGARMALLTSSDTNATGDVRVQGRTRPATFNRPSGNFSFGGGLTVSGTGADISLGSGMSGVAKNVVVSGGADFANFTLNGTATFGQNITLTSRGPANLSMDSRTTVVNGNLTVLSGSDVDTVSINGPRIKGTATIRTGDGGDTVAFDNGTVFEKTVVIDTGAGDDFLKFARATGTFINAVTFTGKATIRTGIGNDQLELGRSVADGGDTTSSANFIAADSVIDGGLNLNGFDDETGQFIGGPTLLKWTDPTNVG